MTPYYIKPLPVKNFVDDIPNQEGSNKYIAEMIIYQIWVVFLCTYCRMAETG